LKNRLKAEQARFLSKGEESEALIRVAFGSLGQKLCVLEPYSLSFYSYLKETMGSNLAAFRAG